MELYICVVVLFCVFGQIFSDCTYGKHKSTKHFEQDKARLKPLIGKRYKTEDALTDGFVYRIGICTSAAQDDEASLSSSHSVPYAQAGVLQTNKKDSPESSAYVVGRFDEAEIMTGTDWILLEYEQGDPYGSHCGGEARRANVMIVCKPGEYQGIMRIIDENNNKTGDCYYLFELDHDAACSYSSGSGSLSVGTVLLLVFFCIVALYLIGGFIYQRFVVGAKGWEQVPNYGFWQDFGNLQADGCNFLCRSGGHNRNPKSYRGIGDDQLQTEEEEERDDHLLPM